MTGDYMDEGLKGNRFPTGPFRLLLGVRVLWTISVQMLLVAMAWHAYEISNDAWALALMGLYQFIPVLLFSIPAGYMVDRFKRQRVVSICLAIQCFTAAGLAYYAWVGEVGTWALYMISILLGLARSTLMPALQAIVPTLVPAHSLARAMASVSTATQVSVIVGPALAGFLIALNVHYVYGISAALFLLAFILPFFMHIQETRVVSKKITIEVLLAGFHFIYKKPVVSGAILLDLFAVLFGGAVALLPIYVKDVLHGSAMELGMLRAAPAAGAILMSFLLVFKPIEKQVGKKLLMAVGVFGVATVIFGISRNFWLSAAALVLNGAADMVSVVIRQTLVQLETPDAMRGRVSAVNSVFIGASNQLGEFQVGAAAALLGPVFAVVLGGTVTAALPFLWRKIFPDLSFRDAMTSRDPYPG